MGSFVARGKVPPARGRAAASALCELCAPHWQAEGYPGPLLESVLRTIITFQLKKVDGSFFSFLSRDHLGVHQALKVYSANRRFWYYGTYKRLGGILKIWELPCLFLNAQMESTFGKPNCLLRLALKITKI